MSRVLEIRDARNDVFLHMTELLDALEPEAKDLHWAILDLGEAFAPEGSDYDVLAVDERVRASPTGLHLTFDELAEFASQLQQVIDGLFIGCSDPSALPRRSDSDSLIIECADIVLSAFDSTLWLITAPEPILDRIASRFDRVDEQDSTEATLSAWGR